MLRPALLGMLTLAALCCAMSVQAADLSSVDKAFLKLAADANMTEAHLGKMAQEQAAESGVKDYGQTLAQDHTKAYEELTVLANKTGESIPKGIDVRRNRAIEELTKQKGAGFDRRFLTHEVQDHRKAIAEFKRETEKGQNADIKAYAQKMIPTLEGHLRKAEELEKSGKGTTAASADRHRR